MWGNYLGVENYQKKKSRMKNHQSTPRILYPGKLPSKDEGKIKIFPDEQKLRDYVASRPTLQDTLKKGLLTHLKINYIKQWVHMCNISFLTHTDVCLYFPIKS